MNIELIRHDFPQLNSVVNNKQLIYFDNAATTLKPKMVIDSLTDYYTNRVANVHRGVHTLSEEGTTRFEESREAVKNFINASSHAEIIFTKGTTDSLNLLATSFGERYVQMNDVILVTTMEHHSNIVPWQLMAKNKQALVVEVPITFDGELDLTKLQTLIETFGTRIKLFTVCHASNTLGTINPIDDIISLCHANNIFVCIDAAQSIAHLPIDVQKSDIDFLAFSAHKMYGPYGVGVLYGKEKLLSEMPPYQGGGAMIKDVSFQSTTFNDLPFKFEAGTPVVAEVLALHAAIKYIEKIGLKTISDLEHQLLTYATQELEQIPDLKIIGKALNKGPVISFIIDGIHPHDLGTILNKEGIAIRTGHHCTLPLLRHFNIPFMARASFSFYNTTTEIDLFIKGLKKAITLLK